MGSSPVVIYVYHCLVMHPLQVAVREEEAPEVAVRRFRTAVRASNVTFEVRLEGMRSTVLLGLRLVRLYQKQRLSETGNRSAYMFVSFRVVAFILLVLPLSCQQPVCRSPLLIFDIVY
jgi:hypothetical protein